ncbi:MAG: pirin family protein [Puniceicoccales bacterium]
MNTTHSNLRSAGSRGRTEIDWLDSHHSFSFGGYYDPGRTRVGPLRVLNDDRVAPGKGFGAHPHRDAEIISYALSGALEHRDSMGNGSVIRAGQFQYMSAGRGVTHSEFNPSPDEAAHFLQIWLLPNETGAVPTYSQADVKDIPVNDGLQLVASGDQDSPIRWRADAELYRAFASAGATITLPQNRSQGYLHVTKGVVEVDGQRLTPGDALVINSDQTGSVAVVESSEFLWFDLSE